MARGRVTKQSADKLACPAGADRTFLWDTDLEGFGVCAFPSGKRVYVIQYRKDGRSRRATIGTHGKLTADQARTEAKKMLGAVQQGVDHVAQRKAARAVPTFAVIAERFLAEHVGRKRKPRTRDAYRVLLDRHVIPAIGQVRLTDLRRADVNRMHAAMIDAPGAANRAVSLISAVWNWAAKAGECEHGANPARGIDRNPEAPKDRFLSIAELGALGAALAKGETEGLPWDADEDGPKAKHIAKSPNRQRRLDPFAVAAIRLLIFTGARLREVLHLKWASVDFDRAMLLLEDSKTGRKAIYLSATALSVLSEIPRTSSAYVFPGVDSAKPRADLKRPWQAVAKEAGLTGLRIHDLRHTFASYGVGASLGLPIVGSLLGHRHAQTTQRYAHLASDPMHRAADTIGATLQAALSGSATKAPTRLRGRAAR